MCMVIRAQDIDKQLDIRPGRRAFVSFVRPTWRRYANERRMQPPRLQESYRAVKTLKSSTPSSRSFTDLFTYPTRMMDRLSCSVL